MTDKERKKRGAERGREKGKRERRGREGLNELCYVFILCRVQRRRLEHMARGIPLTQGCGV